MRSFPLNWHFLNSFINTITYVLSCYKATLSRVEFAKVALTSGLCIHVTEWKVRADSGAGA